MGREVQLESEMVQEKRARLDEKNSMVEKLTKAEKQLEQEKTKAMQSSREMEDIKESMKTQQLINMEMKDYERAVNELKNQLELKTNESNSAVQGKDQWFVHPRPSTFKGCSDQSHFIFEINVGESRIRHRTTLKLNF